jgi:hypothetical protein
VVLGFRVGRRTAGPHLVAGNRSRRGEFLTAADRDDANPWIELNRDVIIAFWDQVITPDEAVTRLQRPTVNLDLDDDETRVLLNLLLREMMDEDSLRLQVLRGILAKFGGLPADLQRKLRHHAPSSAKRDP